MIIEITDNFHKRTEARNVPGAFWDPDRRAWCVDLDAMSPHGKQVLTALFPEHAHLIDFTVDTTVRPIDLATPWRGSTTREDLLPGVRQAIRDKLHEYQVTDLGYVGARLRSNGGAYLGWDRGLGKTLGTLVTAEHLADRHVVVVAPASSKRLVWEPEIRKWYPDASVHHVEGDKNKRARSVAQWLASPAPYAYLLVHYEAVRLLDPLTCDLLVVDEAHRLANGAARGTKVPKFYRNLRKYDRRHTLCLSGSVMNNAVDELFGALHLLFPGTYKSKYRDWTDRYVLQVPGTYSARIPVGVKPDKVDDLRNELAAFMCIRSKEDELDMPELIEDTVHVDLSPMQRKVYDDLATNLFASIPGTDEQIVSVNAIANIANLRQVAAGLSVDGEVVDSTKLNYVAEAVYDAAPSKTVVFTWHRDVADAAADYCRAVGVGAAVVHGGVKQKDRELEIARFRDDPECAVLCATIKTLGESVNLQFASNVIFVESSWVPSDMDQARDRVYRQGQKHRVHVVTLVARDTVDELRVMPAVRSKAALAKLVLGR